MRSPDPTESEILEAFHDVYRRDLLAGRIHSLAHYQALFAGHAELIAAEYRDLEDEEEDEGEPNRERARSLVRRSLGPYRIEKELGRGGQAIVYRAEHRSLGRKVALKVVHAETFDLHTDTGLRRFQREAEITAKLDHPGICSVYESGQDGEWGYIAMRYVSGVTLGQLIRQTKMDSGSEDSGSKGSGSGMVSWTESSESDATPLDRRSSSSAQARRDLLKIVQLIERTALALHRAHEQGLIHRDVKPGNIMVTDEGDPVVLDFGLAREEESTDDTLTRKGDLVGTPYYMSPEQLKAEPGGVDRRTDVYALGVTLYECLTLRRPFEAASRQELYQKIRAGDVPDAHTYNRHIPRDLSIVLAVALERDRDRRYPTALAFAEDLRRIRRSEPVHARPPSAAYRLRKFTSRNRALVAGISGIFVTSVIGIVVAIILAIRVGREAQAVERRAYLVALTSAENELRAHDVRAARLSLSGVPLAQRGWEWRHLWSRLDDSLGELVIAPKPRVEARSQHLAPLPGEPRKFLVRTDYGDGRFEYTRFDTDTGRVSSFEPPGIDGFPPPIQIDSWWVTRNDPNGTIAQSRVNDHTVMTWQVADYGFTPGTVVPISLGDDGDFMLVRHRASESSTGLFVLDRRSKTRWPIPSRGLPYRSGVLPGRRVYFKTREAGAFVMLDARRRIPPRGFEGQVESVAASADGAMVATISSDCILRLWDAPTLRVLRTASCGRKWFMNNAVFTPDGSILAVQGKDSAVRVWDTRTLKLLTTLHGHTGPGEAGLMFSANGSVLASRGRRRWLFWDTTARRDLRVLIGHESYVYPVAFAPDGRHVVSGGWDKAESVRVWDLDKRTQVRGKLDGHGEAPVTALTVSPDGRRIATADQGILGGPRTLIVWDLDTGKEVARHRHLPGNLFGPLAFHPDGNRVVWSIRPEERIVDVFDVRTNEVTRAPPGFLRELRGSLAASNGSTIVLAEGGTLASYDATTWTRLAGFAAHSSYNKFALHTDPRGLVRLVAAERELTKVGVWDARTGTRIATLAGHSDEVIAVAVSPDGNRIATGGRDETVRIWDGQTYEQCVALHGHEWYVFDLAWSPDGQTLVSSSGDGTIRVWDTKPLRDLTASRGR